VWGTRRAIPERQGAAGCLAAEAAGQGLKLLLLCGCPIGATGAVSERAAVGLECVDVETFSMLVALASERSSSSTLPARMNSFRRAQTKICLSLSWSWSAGAAAPLPVAAGRW